jgi:hypothetical protein
MSCRSNQSGPPPHAPPRCECADGVEFDGSPPDLAATEGIERVTVGAAQADAQHTTAIRHGQNDLGGAVIGANLDAETGSHQHLAFLGVADRLGAGVILPVGHV